MLEVLFGFGHANGPDVVGVPGKLATDAMGDIAQQDGFGERAGVIEAAQCFSAAFAGFSPFLVMSDGIGDEFGGWLESGKTGFRE